MRADRDAILVAVVQILGKLPPKFDPERFTADCERLTRDGKTTDEIARFLAAQWEAAPTPRKPQATQGSFLFDEPTPPKRQQLGLWDFFGKPNSGK